LCQSLIERIEMRREFVDAGGLMSYGTSVYDSWRQVGNYVGLTIPKS